MLPGVVRFNAGAASYGGLCAAAGLRDAEHLASRIEELLALAGLAASLGSFGVTPENIPQLAEEAAKQWTATFNPRAITAKDFAEMYAART
jgi:alcohol dehydrogenase